jgi:D-alanyl-D-alanine carboxypeptidase (penicillin-binding protein 5/6)
VIAVAAPTLAETQQEVTAFVVMNAKSGRVLMQRAAHQKLYPASTTKAAFVAYVLSTQGLDLSQKLVVPLEAVKSLSDGEKSRDNYTKYPSYILEARSTHAGLKAGEIITLKDALFGAMLPSGNDAANTLAYYWGKGSIETCVEQVNHFVESIGCLNTRFTNPHGLHHPSHTSTAYDLALIARYALQMPLFRQIVSSPSFTKEKTNKQPSVTWQQTNKLVVPGPYYYDLATGVKTGYHARALNCLIASGETSDRSIIVVLLHCPDRKQMFVGAKKLLQKFLTEEKTHRVVVEKGPLQLKREIEGQVVPLSLFSPRESSVTFYLSEEPSIKAVAEWKELKFPVEQGQEIGLLRIFADDQEVDHVPLLASERREMTWQQRLIVLQKFLQNHRSGVVTISVIIGLLIVIALFFRGRRRAHRR